MLDVPLEQVSRFTEFIDISDTWRSTNVTHGAIHTFDQRISFERLSVHIFQKFSASLAPYSVRNASLTDGKERWPQESVFIFFTMLAREKTAIRAERDVYWYARAWLGGE
jgi:hypothetical protein